MPPSEERLIGLQRAEFTKASRLQTLTALILITIAAVSGVAVFITLPILSYAAAVLALVLVIVWAFFDWRFRECRSQAERARRATLIIAGLGETISLSELKDLEAHFSVSPEKAAKHANPDYYVAKAAAGFERLAEMLEESTFWTYHLIRTSGRITWLIFAATLIFGLVLFFAAVPFFQASELQGAVRVFCAILALLASSEFLGRALSYSVASATLNSMRSRLEAARAANFPRADLLLLLCDYSSTVEGAPMPLPGVYKFRRNDLNRIWASAQAS